MARRLQRADGIPTSTAPVVRHDDAGHAHCGGLGQEVKTPAVAMASIGILMLAYSPLELVPNPEQRNKDLPVSCVPLSKCCVGKAKARPLELAIH